MSSPNMETEEPTSSNIVEENEGSSKEADSSVPVAECPRPPSKRRISSTVIEISDTESDDSDICAVTSYQASADEVKRIRGADYSSSSTSSEYSSDSESSWEDDSVLVEDDPPRRKLVRAQLYSRANRMDDPKLNPALKSQEFIDKLKTHWKESMNHSSEEVTLTCDPFRLCLLQDFLGNAEIINNIIDDMNTLDWSRKKMDLYEFHQTADLASLTWQRGIKGIYELLKTEVMNWVSDVTGLELRSVSASCSLYGPGDHLLTHDDRLGDRRVAFILYLAPWRPRPEARLENGTGDHGPVDVEACGWAEHMGGALELLSRDEEGRPAQVVHRVFPRNNMFAFFKVGVDSFHQVGEVVSLELPRLSINGWYHGPTPEGEADVEADADTEAEAEPMPTPLPPHNDVVLLNQWVEASYMSPRNRVKIQAQMERESEVSLHDFLLPQRREELLTALRDSEVPWEAAGPANRRRYSRVPAAWVALEAGQKEHCVRGLLSLLASAAFCRMLADCTDLPLTRLARLELQRWGPGDYTLLPARAAYASSRLEALLYVGVAGGGAGGGGGGGGGTAYVAPEDTPTAPAAALVTVPPHDNALSLVYCDAGAASFTKYLSRMTMRPDQHFYIVTCTYYE